MRTQRIIFWGICALLCGTAQSQAWEWVKQGGGGDYDYAWSTCTDDSGNVYAFGWHRSDPFDLDGTTLHVETDQIAGMFLAKYDGTGAQQWVRSFAGYSAGELVYDPQTASLLLGGYMTGHVTFGTITLTGHGDKDALLARFDLSGECLWARNFGGAGDDRFSAIAIGPNGGVVATGPLESSLVIFDPFPVNAGVVMASFDDEGTCRWAKRKFTAASPPPFHQADPVALSSFSGKIYVFGPAVPSHMTIDGVEYNAHTMFGNEYMLARLDSMGVMEWMLPCGGAPNSYPVGDMDLDEEGRVFVAGQFNYLGYFGEDTLEVPGSADMFVAMADTSGEFHWSAQVGASGSASGNDLLADGAGGVFVLGGLRGSGYLGEFPIDTGDSIDMFVAHYQEEGDCLGYVQMEHATGRRMALAPNNAVYVAGYFKGTATFMPEITLTSTGQHDAFLALTGRVVSSIGETRSTAGSDLLIYANPNAGTCRIDLPEDLLHERGLYLTIYDSGGRLVQRSRVLLENGTVRLDIRAEAKGIYRVEVGNERVRRIGNIIFE